MPNLSFDPQNLPIASIAGEPALPEERLSAAWLRKQFADPPEWHPEIADENMPQANGRTPIRASVLLPIVQRAGFLTMLLTRRAAHLTDHAGQISFPGGRAEAADASAIETALRETEEEVGLHRRHIEVIGTLPDYLTRTGYLVTPVVAIVLPPFELQIDAFEVDEVFEVPLPFLMNGMNHQLRSIELADGLGPRSFYAMSYERYFIWGATAGMLRNLFQFLRA